MQEFVRKLSMRLQAAADLVTAGNRVADVGTDHGFLVIYLVQSGRCPGAVAMDIREGPLERAREHIREAGLQGSIRTRLSDGLRELTPGEAECAAAVGMGGLTILHVLEDAGEKLQSFQELVLGPQSDIAKVRRWLREHSMYIDKEELVLEGGKFYPLLHVDMNPRQGPAGAAGTCGSDTKGRPYSAAESKNEAGKPAHGLFMERLGDSARVQDVFDRYGEYPVCHRHPVLPLLLERDRMREEAILRGLEKEAGMFQTCSVADRKQQRREDAQARLEEIGILLEFLSETKKTPGKGERA